MFMAARALSRKDRVERYRNDDESEPQPHAMRQLANATARYADNLNKILGHAPSREAR
jgi:hypothetical protein